ncbi:MAG: OadG family protein [Spirochaetales bacterium]|nr:OadG family protein [Spirochaetales bacterium]
MNIESFGYAVISALVGMAIVFIFLVVLSVIMVVLRRVLDPTKDEFSARGEGDAIDRERAVSSTDGDPPPWVIAGVMAYLSAEEHTRAPRAGVWTKWERQ